MKPTEIKKLQLRFLQRLQNHLTYSIDIRTIDIQYYLTIAQERYIEDMYSRFKGEEALRKRLAGVYIDSILTDDNRLESSSERKAFRGGELWYLPEDVRYVLDEYVQLEGIDRFIPVKPVDASYINKQENNPFKKPYNKLVWRLDRGYCEVEDSEDVATHILHELVISESSDKVQTYGVVYIKTPKPVELTNPEKLWGFEVTVEYHDEIIDIAIEVALQTLALAGRIKNDAELNNPN